MANRPLGEIGSILIATRDSDFALVARAIEEIWIRSHSEVRT